MIKRLGPNDGTSARFRGIIAKRGVQKPVSEPVEPQEPVTAPVEPQEPVAADEGFDPSAHTVAEVQAYLGEHPDQTDYVLDRERAGKARTTLTGGA